MADSASSPEPAPARDEAAKLVEVATVFLRLGITAFGGPAAHVAIMENEIVRRRRWVSHERFLDLFGAASLIPGPSSSELAIYLGYERAGPVGLLIAGTCFILPAAIVTGLLAWAYVRFGALPEAFGALYGIKPVIIAIVAQAVLKLAPKAAKNAFLVAVGVFAAFANVAGLDAIEVLLGAGVLSAAWKATTRKNGPRGSALVFGPTLAAAGAAATPESATLLALFLFFLKIGAVVFGSGYVLLAFLRADLVDRLHWLTESQLLDAVAVGQVTPGPVFTTATFIGYLLGGTKGAAVATVAIFLPSFMLVAATRPLLARVRRSAIAGAFLDGVNVASLSLMAVVTAELGKAALVDVPTILLGVAALVVLLEWKVNSAWLIAAGAIVGASTHVLK